MGVNSVEGDPNGIASFSACKGRGVRGWISAFGETIVIEPKMLHYDENSFINYKRLHRIDDEHLVYKESDLDTTGWAGDCGNGYDTHSHTHSNTHSYTKLNPDHPEDHAHKRHGRGYHPDKNDNHVVATPSRSAVCLC